MEGSVQNFVPTGLWKGSPGTASIHRDLRAFDDPVPLGDLGRRGLCGGEVWYGLCLTINIFLGQNQLDFFKNQFEYDDLNARI
jgi:hypothetical protein